jgi:CDP-glycerol glycerophosphotransferase (TagB/SpsB family)
MTQSVLNSHIIWIPQKLKTLHLEYIFDHYEKQRTFSTAKLKPLTVYSSSRIRMEKYVTMFSRAQIMCIHWWPSRPLASCETYKMNHWAKTNKKIFSLNWALILVRHDSCVYRNTILFYSWTFLFPAFLTAVLFILTLDNFSYSP